MTLAEKYPPSETCSCDICRNYCYRPGWWTVELAEKAIELGFAKRMMFEIALEQNFGVLSPAFKGNEGGYALQVFSKTVVLFLKMDCANYLIPGCNLLNVVFAITIEKEMG